MSTIILPSRSGIVCAALRREWLSHRLNRFLYAHLALVLVAGALPLLTPGDAFARGAAWWLLHAVLYAVSLSSLLLGLSSAHAEADEFVWLLGQPSGVGPWLGGKALALVVLTGSSATLLGLPTAMMGGGSPELALATAGAAGVAVVCALMGLALGFWIRDSVRGLIAAVAVWLALLFGVDILLLALAGAPGVQANPDLWIVPLMLNPLDAYRITVLFAVERAAFSGLNAGHLAGWWSTHAPLWLGVLTFAWSGLALFAAWLGASRRID
jgi:ABC-2 type transport system permease protein/Cu-processing system permease protein